jgi:16S rRNA (cytosine1402-N4)-methyltransferase
LNAGQQGHVPVSPADLSNTQHASVLFQEVMDLLDPRPGGRFIDCTVNGGGHAEGMLERSSPDGRLLGLDADPGALERAGRRLARFGSRLELAHANFRHLDAVARRAGFTAVQGVLMDLGISSHELEGSGRGFSFQRLDEPLDMRLDPTQGPTAADILNLEREPELARILREYGEEWRGSRLARVIVQHRRQQRFQTVADLLAAVEQAIGPKRTRLHPATRTFQALRIATNDELDAIEEGLRASLLLLAPGGRVAVIAFHSLEDRIAKRLLRAHAEEGAVPPLRLLTKKPVTPSRSEELANPRSRSAKLRVAERVA